MNRIKNFNHLRLHFVAGFVVMAIAVLVLLGWHFDLPLVKSVFPGYVTMKVNTALGLILFSAVSLCIHPNSKRSLVLENLGRVLALLGGLFGFLTLLQYVFKIDLGIDELFYRDLESLGPSYPAGRLAPITAISFILYSAALWFGPLALRPRHRLSQILFFIVALASFQALVEYLLGMQTSFGIGNYTRIAIHTAISFILLSMGFLSLSSHRGHMRIFLNATEAGILARNLVLSLIFMPPVFKFIVLVGESLNFFDSNFGALIRSVLSITFFVTLVLRSADRLYRAERNQRRISAALQQQEKERESNRAGQMVAEAVQASEARFRMIFSSAFDGIIGFNSQSIISEWNPRAEKIFGWSYSEAVGKNMVHLIFPPEEHEGKLARFKAICDSYDFSIFDKPIEDDAVTREGKKISIRLGISFMHVSGELLFIATIQDVSVEKKSENDLIASREQALNATRSKSEFLANMSHEIRTPMNGVIGMATVLLDSSLTESQRESTKLIKQSAESLLSIINGILDHSKIEAGKIELEKLNFRFEDVARDVIQVLQIAADEKGISLRLQLDKRTNAMVVGDPGRLRQILMNLISNAIKFTDQGEVVLKVISEISDDSVKVRFMILDNGPGLSEKETQKLFQVYGQTDAGVKKGGTGLGLYISSVLIKLMNGHFGVESQVGIGSVFWFEVNFLNSEEISQITRVDTHRSLSGRVLVAEDQIVNQRVIGSYLAKLGVSFDMAANGAIALQMLENSQYDLILMDCRMPIMDGYETTAFIREKEKNNAHRIPIVALSAEISIDDRKKCIDLGMDEFLGKPVDIAKLEHCLSNWLSPSTEKSFVIDQNALEKLRGYTSGSKDLISVLMVEFLGSSSQAIEDMHVALQTKNMRAISNLAHGLRSTSATLGLMRVTEICQNIESLTIIPHNMISLISRLEVEVLLAETEMTRLRSN